MFPLVWSFQFQVTPGFTSGHVNAVSKTIAANAQKFMKDAEEALDGDPASDRKALPVEGPGVVLGLDHLLQLEVEKNQVAEKATSISKTVLDRETCFNTFSCTFFSVCFSPSETKQLVCSMYHLDLRLTKLHFFMSVHIASMFTSCMFY